MSEEKTTPETIKKCPTIIIPDEPVKKDAFDGPHKKVALAISEIVQSDEVGGKMIGLQGGWGAGKSTVVSLFQQEISNNNEIAVFYFDTWAHEGDPLRRTFLESLIRFFRKKRWVKLKLWQTKLELLSKRRRINKTKTIPRTTWFGFAMACSALLVPIGAPLVVDGLKNGSRFFLRGNIDWQFSIGSLFLIMPLMVIAFNSIVSLIRYLTRSEDDKEKERKLKEKGEPLPSYFAFWAGSTITEVYNDTTETTDPTSIEFEDTFRSLMKSALPKNSNKKVVIILDNLDRVDPNYALGIWSTLQTFLQQRHIDQEDWFKKLWILVPYDKKGLSNLWAKEGDDEKVAESFIDKSFQLRFDVPPLVFSNWKSLLIELLGTALPSHAVDEFDEVYRVYNLCLIGNAEPPTPRQLKIFVNEIGSVHRQWGDNFPLSHIAYFVLMKRMDDNVIDQIIAWDENKQKTEAFLGNKLKGNLSGLAFNVDSETGLQLVLKKPVFDALATNDSIELKSLLERHKGGFWVMFDQIIAEDISSIDVTTLANIANCLVDSGVLNGRADHEKNHVKTRLKSIAEAQNSWPINSPELSSGLTALCELISDSNFSKKIYATARETVKQIKIAELPIANDEFIGYLNHVLDYAHRKNLKEVLEDMFELPLPVDQWVDTCSIIKKKCDPYLWGNICPNVGPHELTQILVDSISAGGFIEKHIHSIEVSGHSFEKIDWQPVINSIQSRMDVNNSIQNREIDLLITALYSIKTFDNSQANSGLKNLVDNGQILHWLHQAVSQNQKECIAWPLIAYLEQSPAATIAPNVGNSLAGKNNIDELLAKGEEFLATHILEILANRGSYQLLFDVIETRDKKDLLTHKCLMLGMDEKYYQSIFTSPTIINHWCAIYYSIVEFESVEVYNALLNKLCETTGLVPDIETNPDGFVIGDSGLYSDIIQLHGAKSFQAWCIQGLQKVSSSDWLKALDDSKNILDVLIALKNKDLNVGLEVPYADAHEAYARKLLEDTLEDQIDEKYKPEWSKLLSGIDDEKIRGNLRRKLLESSIKFYEGKIDVFIELYGYELIESDTLLKQSSEVIDKLFSRIITDKIPEGLEWIKTLISKYPKFVDDCDDKFAVTPFISRMKSVLKSESDNSKIKEIADILGIEPDPVAELDPTPDPGSTKNEDAAKE